MKCVPNIGSVPIHFMNFTHATYNGVEGVCVAEIK